MRIPPNRRRLAGYLAATAVLPVLAISPASAQMAFDPMEATIATIHEALTSGAATCVEITQSFLDRIEAYDQAGPVLNGVQSVNPNALDEAAAIDAALAAGEPLDTLTCVPAAVKDQFETNFMPTTYGSILFKEFMSPRNAAVVDLLMEAGAIILAKTNLGEFAAGGSGSAFGDCHNAYNVLYYASGSSCGTGIAVTANYAVIGIGEDTAGSARGPASHENLFGLRPTTGLISLFGAMPQAPTRDTVGPISRTIEDMAILLDVIAGYDERDPITARAIGNIPESYTAMLGTDLEGLRFGIIRTPMANNTDTTAPDYLEIRDMVTATGAALEAAGAEIVDNIEIPDLLAMISASGYNFETEVATDAYLAQLPEAPYQVWAEIAVDPRITESRRSIANNLGRTPVGDPEFAAAILARSELSDVIYQAMAAYDLDGLVYAPFDRAPPLLPGITTSSNRLMSTYIGFPSIVVPAGLNSEGIPIGVEIMTRPWTEALLMRVGYAYEQVGDWRVLPPTAPPLAP